MSNWQSLLTSKQGKAPSVSRADEHDRRVILVGRHTNGTYSMMADGNFLLLFADAAIVDATLVQLQVSDTHWE